MDRLTLVYTLLSGRIDPHVTLTLEEASRVYSVARRAAEGAVKDVLSEREVDELSARITPEVVTAAERGGLWLTQNHGLWWANMGDAHPYALAEHGPARAWLTRYFNEQDAQ